MTEWALALVLDWGAWLVFFATLLSCLALPVPSSLIMLAGGAFASTGDLGLVEVALSALLGAVIGDNIGFWAGGRARTWFPKISDSRLGRRAAEFLSKRGAVAVFLSRWLFSPLGPYVNVLAGSAGMTWPRFFWADLAGEIAWVSIYVGLGYAFVAQIALIADVLGDVLGLLSAVLVTVVLGREIWRRMA